MKAPTPTPQEAQFWNTLEIAWADAPDIRSLANEKLVTKSMGSAEMRKSAEEAAEFSFNHLDLRRDGMTDEDVARAKASTVDAILKQLGVGFGAELNKSGLQLSAYVNTTLFSRVAAVVSGETREEARLFILTSNELKNRLLKKLSGEIVGDSDHYKCAFAVALGQPYYDRILSGELELPAIMMSEAFAYQLRHKYEEIYGSDDAAIAECAF